MITRTSTRLSRRRLPIASGMGLLVFALLIGCSPAITRSADQGVRSQDGSPSVEPSLGSQTPDDGRARPASFKTNVADGSEVKVSTVVSVKISDGTIASVKLRAANKPMRVSDGQARTPTSSARSVSGRLSADQTRWTASEGLDPAASYSLVMAGANAQGVSVTSKTSFRTKPLTLNEQTYPSIYPATGATVGVGMPIVLRFDLPVTDRANFEKKLTVSSAPAQAGSWRWYGEREVHYRPQAFWKPGTTVTVRANLNGASAGHGIYGQRSVTSAFRVGRSQITKINLKTGQAVVYAEGKVARRIAVSGGKPGWETRSGTKLIMSRETNKRMTNQMIGAKEAFDLNVAYAMRITTSGEFLHSAPWNAQYLGNQNVSHGCTGMSTADAAWLYKTSLIGDPTITTGSRRSTRQGNGWADWNLTWVDYQKGSAL